MTDRKERNRLRSEADRMAMEKALRALEKRKPHLEGETRIHAARFVRERYDMLRDDGMKANEIERRLGEMQGLSREVRLARWMLKKTEVLEATADLVVKYDGESFPLKKACTYLTLVAGMAKIADVDPQEAKFDFLRATGLDRGLRRVSATGKAEFDPVAGLLQLLRDFAGHTAVRLDFAALFERAMRLEAGWDATAGPEPLLLKDALQRMAPAAIFNSAWLMDVLPALPSVTLAFVPLGMMESAGFELHRPGGAPQHARGRATSHWRVDLAIAPTEGGGVTPCLVRTLCTVVVIDADADADADGGDSGQCEIEERGEGLDALHPDSHVVAKTRNDPDLSIRFDAETTARYTRTEDDRLPLRAGEQRVHQRTSPEENLPHEGIPVGEIEPLDHARLRLWLRDGAGRDDYEIVRGPVLQPFIGSAAQDEPLWFEAPCLARDTERALRAGALLEALTAWEKAFSKGLARLESARRANMSAADDAQRADWATDREVVFESELLEGDR
jgi:hypothetical protein